MTHKRLIDNISSRSDTEKQTIKVTIEQPKKKIVIEKGGPKGPEPTRYGDWERKGRCVDF